MSNSEITLPQLIEFPTFCEIRGDLTVVEGASIPFPTRRVFWITHPSGIRANHAHLRDEQVVVAVCGSCYAMVEYHSPRGMFKTAFFLSSSRQGLYLPNSSWLTLNTFSADCVLLVLCAYPYTKPDVITNYEQFCHPV
jgi:hypothetical protein